MSPTDHAAELARLADVYVAVDCADPLTTTLIASITDACDRVEDSKSSRVVLVQLTDSSPAGTEPSWPGEVGIHLVNHWERALRRLERLSAVTITVADGDCAGPAVEVLLATDYRIAGTGLRLSPPLSSGGTLWPGMLVHRLANQLGIARARQLVLFAPEVDALQAERVGLVDEVADDVVARASVAAATVRESAGYELAIRRRLLLDAATTNFEDALGAHLAACDRSLIRARDQVAADPVALSVGSADIVRGA